MQTISDLKEQAVTDTPLLIFDCVLAERPDGTVEHAPGDGGRIDVPGASSSAQRLRHSDGVRPGHRRKPANLGCAGQRRLALFGDRARDGMEGRAADRRVPVLRFAERRPADGYGGGVSGNLQPAGPDQAIDIPPDGHQPDEPATADASADPHPTEMPVAVSGDARTSGPKPSTAAPTASIRCITVAAIPPGSPGERAI